MSLSFKPSERNNERLFPHTHTHKIILALNLGLGILMINEMPTEIFQSFKRRKIRQITEMPPTLIKIKHLNYKCKKIEVWNKNQIISLLDGSLGGPEQFRSTGFLDSRSSIHPPLKPH